ncbi:MAG: oligosaccharide flippase family protein, partial [Nanoarchaeota archaeon]
MNKDENIRKIITGSLIVILGLIVTKLLGYIFRLIIARFGPEQYGLFSLGLSIVTIGSLIALMGLDRGILRYVSYYIGSKDNTKIRGTIIFAFKATIISGLLLAIIIFFLAPIISTKIYHNNGLISIIKILAFSIPAYVLSEVCLSIIKAYREVKYMVYSKNMLEGIIKIILSLIAIYLGYSIFGVSIAYTLSLFFTFIISLYFIEKKIFPFLKDNVKAQYNNKQLLVFSLPLLLNNIMELTLISTDTLLIGYFLSSNYVGIYNAAFPTAALVMSIPVSILTIFTPTIGKLAGEGNIEEQKKIFRISSKWIFFVSLPISLIFIFFS